MIKQYESKEIRVIENKGKLEISKKYKTWFGSEDQFSGYIPAKYEEDGTFIDYKQYLCPSNLCKCEGYNRIEVRIFQSERLVTKENYLKYAKNILTAKVYATTDTYSSRIISKGIIYNNNFNLKTDNPNLVLTRIERLIKPLENIISLSRKIVENNKLT